MRDEQGNDYYDRITIEVVSSEDTEAEIKTQWDAMVLELINGNVETALNYFDEGSQDEYRWLFNNMDSSKVSAIFSGVTDFKLRSLNDGIAHCAAMRDESGESYAYPITMVQAKPGIWRIVEL